MLILRRIVTSVESGNPFTQTNVRRLYCIAGLLAAVPFLQMIDTSISATLWKDAMGRGTAAGSLLDVLFWIAALGVLTLAQVFAHGVKNQDDLEGTV